MVKIEAESLESAYALAAQLLECSVTELQVEIIQYPSKGLFGLFRKHALIGANCKPAASGQEKNRYAEPAAQAVTQSDEPAAQERPAQRQRLFNDTILPETFVTDQDEDEDVIETPRSSFNHADVSARFFEERPQPEAIADEVRHDINMLFSHSCFRIDPVQVSVHDENTLLIEFTGEDAALLIGKEGYRYKALSYMIFNWINAKYQMQLRLEIAEFLKNQEESVARYLVGVCENVDRDGRAQTKILDGVLVQIALKQLRARYPDKYVAIRSTRDGSKFIIVNHYNEY